jgi:hypothetical protein
MTTKIHSALIGARHEAAATGWTVREILVGTLMRTLTVEEMKEHLEITDETNKRRLAEEIATRALV